MRVRSRVTLLGILLSTLTLFTSKRNQSGKPVCPQNTSGNESAHIPKEGADRETEPVKTTDRKNESDGGTKSDWVKISALAQTCAVPIAIGLLIITICQMRSTEKAATAAETANKNAQAALTITEQAYMTIGRKDAVIVLYFQNAGESVDLSRSPFKPINGYIERNHRQGQHDTDVDCAGFADHDQLR